jgi:beta-mannan synthase
MFNEVFVQCTNSTNCLLTLLKIEQTGRAAAYGCFGFNGTGGVWRVAAIKHGGGWSADSVTEDLALSYQVFMKGYKFVYLRNIPQLLEVPGNFLAYVQQKHRWTKVSLNCIRLSD